MPTAAELATFPGAPAALGVVPVFLLVLLWNGLSEETGWRGFLFERLAPGNRFRAVLLVGMASLGWHAPLFAIRAGRQAMAGPALLGRAASLLAAFVLGHLHLAAGRSSAAPALFHAVFNMATAPPVLAGLPAAAASAPVVAGAAAIALLWGHAPLRPAGRAARRRRGRSRWTHAPPPPRTATAPSTRDGTGW